VLKVYWIYHFCSLFEKTFSNVLYVVRGHSWRKSLKEGHTDMRRMLMLNFLPMISSMKSKIEGKAPKEMHSLQVIKTKSKPVINLLSINNWRMHASSWPKIQSNLICPRIKKAMKNCCHKCVKFEICYISKKIQSITLTFRRWGNIVCQRLYVSCAARILKTQMKVEEQHVNVWIAICPCVHNVQIRIRKMKDSKVIKSSLIKLCLLMASTKSEKLNIWLN